MGRKEGRDWQEAARAASQNESYLESLAEDSTAWQFIASRYHRGLMTRFVIALFWLSALAAQAVELIAPPKVTQSEVSATIAWRTDVACGTRVSFGTALDKLDQKLEGAVSADHTITLPNLAKGTTYYYQIGSARQNLAAGSFVFGNDTAATPAPHAAAPKSILNKIVDALTPTAPKPKPAASSPTAARAPPTRQTWGRIDSLQDHFDRHGADFQSTSPDDYAAQAWHFLQRGKAGQVPMKWDDSDSSLRVYDPKTRAFAAYNRDGTTKTYFRPNSPTYWPRQPGRPISPAQLPFK